MVYKRKVICRIPKADPELVHRIEVLEAKVAHYHPDGVSMSVDKQTVYVGRESTIVVHVAATMQAESIKLYRGGTLIHEVADNTTFDHQDTVNPQDDGTIDYRVVATISGVDYEANASVNVVADYLTVQIGSGADYASAVFTDTQQTLSNNMAVVFEPNNGDHLFIKVDKRNVVTNLYTNPVQGQDYEIPIDGGTVVGDYKYYTSTILLSAGDLRCKINKTI